MMFSDRFFIYFGIKEAVHVEVSISSWVSRVQRTEDAELGIDCWSMSRNALRCAACTSSL